MNIQTLKEASDCLLNLAKPETQTIEHILLQDAFERIIAEDITAKIPVPSFSKSAYDGYALRQADTAAASPEHPVTLDVTEVIPAGSVPTCPITDGKAARIMTGAPVPEGADAIIMHERTSFTENTVTLTSPVASANIIPPGEDVTAGTLLVPKGKILTASDLALIAGQGIADIEVYKKLSIGLISTGSELLDTGSPLEYGKIYNTNPYLLGGYIQKHHMTANYLNTVSDDLDSLCRAVLEALKTNDIVITTGGVSAGDFDYMPEVIRRIGGDLLFHRLKFKPGGAMLGAFKDGKVILGLSGNPGAAATGLLCVGFPFMRKLSGRSDITFSQTTAYLGVDFKKSSPVTRILKGHSDFKNGMLYFTPLSNQHNGSVSSMSDCDLLAVIPAGSKPLAAGDKLEVYIL